MTITNNGIIVKICQISSLYQLLEAREQLGEPCLLLIYAGGDTVLGRNSEEKAAARSFLENAPFMSAVVSAGDADAELAGAADLRLSASEADEYTEKLFRDKMRKQIEEINACFIAARTAPAEKVLDMESRAFYRLMTDRNGGAANG